MVAEIAKGCITNKNIKYMNTISKILLFSLLISVLPLGFSSCIEEKISEGTHLATLNPVCLIYEVREAYIDSDIDLGPKTLNDTYMTTGVVISDNTDGNIPKNYLIIQSTDPISTATTTIRGIGLLFEFNNVEDNIFNPGDSLVIDLRGTKLRNINGDLHVTGLTLDKVRRQKTGIKIEPKTITTTQLYTFYERYANMLIQLDCEFSPLPEDGDILSGEKSFYVGKDSLIYLQTDPKASFANNPIQASAQFTGIAFKDGNKRCLRMQYNDDMKYAAGPLYKGWPEDFEYPSIKDLGLADDGGLIPKSMTSYDNSDNMGYFKTGKWKLYFSILVDPEISATSGRDRVSGAQGIRMQQNLWTAIDQLGNTVKHAYLEMQFDLLEGASKVTYTYGSYYNDVKSSFVLEYSTDKGKTWQEAHQPIYNPQKEMRVAMAMLDNIKGSVRFRIKKGLEQTPDGRLSIDNIQVYKGVW